MHYISNGIFNGNIVKHYSFHMCHITLTQNKLKSLGVTDGQMHVDNHVIIRGNLTAV